MFRRVNLYGAAGCGKSTIGLDITPKLKKRGFCVELVQEGLVKLMAYEKNPPKKWDQMRFFYDEFQKEYDLLSRGVQTVISDSPLMLGPMYGTKNKIPYCSYLFEVARQFEYDYPSINIFIERVDSYYKNEGRYEDLAQAKEMDEYILQSLDDLNVPFARFSVKDTDGILAYTKWALDKEIKEPLE